MPTIEENLQGWDATYDWKSLGEEWSSGWGGSEAQWYGALLPRIYRFLPAERILEIAPGYGRWTQFLKSGCERLDIVDLSENCIKACRKRFASEKHIGFHVNDGKSLAMIDNNSIDFAFSFDSLVHVELDVIQLYLQELAKKLTRDGIAFIHHSNAGEFGLAFALGRSLSGVVLNSLVKTRVLDRQQGRALSMTAKCFEECATRAGLKCISQELVNWDSRRLIDCMSIVTPTASRWAQPNRIVRNGDFMREASLIRRLASAYVAG
jgi:ubiquinone/menaquinone biosynthesis C-methylase UbiE